MSDLPPHFLVLKLISEKSLSYQLQNPTYANAYDLKIISRDLDRFFYDVFVTRFRDNFPRSNVSSLLLCAHFFLVFSENYLSEAYSRL